MDLTHPAFTVMNSATVLFKCKLTVSTRNSILDTRCFRESRIEFRGSSFEFRVSSIEFRVSRRSKNFSRKRFISSLRRKNNTHTSQLNKNVCQREMIFLALSDSSELKFQLACRMQIHHVLLRLNELANVK